jgi:cytochrome P450
MIHILEANEHLMEFMKARVKERKAEVGSMAPSDRNANTTETDALTTLVEANEDGEGKFQLDEEEVVR